MGTAINAEVVHQGERRDRLGRRHYPAERRQQLLEAFRESGLTRWAFARREGIRYTTLCTWVEKAAKTVGRAPRPEAVVRFAEVAVPASASASLEVRLPDGTLLRGGNALELAALVRAVRG
jgi:transposase-like protein